MSQRLWIGSAGENTIHNPMDIIDEEPIYNVPMIIDQSRAFIMQGELWMNDTCIMSQELWITSNDNGCTFIHERGWTSIYNGSAIIKEEWWGNIHCMTAIYKIDGSIVVRQLSTSHLRQLSILYILACQTLVFGGSVMHDQWIDLFSTVAVPSSLTIYRYYWHATSWLNTSWEPWAA